MVFNSFGREKFKVSESNFPKMLDDLDRMMKRIGDFYLGEIEYRHFYTLEYPGASTVLDIDSRYGILLARVASFYGLFRANSDLGNKPMNFPEDVKELAQDVFDRGYGLLARAVPYSLEAVIFEKLSWSRYVEFMEFLVEKVREGKNLWQELVPDEVFVDKFVELMKHIEKYLAQGLLLGHQLRSGVERNRMRKYLEKKAPPTPEAFEEWANGIFSLRESLEGTTTRLAEKIIEGLQKAKKGEEESIWRYIR